MNVPSRLGNTRTEKARRRKKRLLLIVNLTLLILILSGGAMLYAHEQAAREASTAAALRAAADAVEEALAAAAEQSGSEAEADLEPLSAPEDVETWEGVDGASDSASVNPPLTVGSSVGAASLTAVGIAVEAKEAARSEAAEQPTDDLSVAAEAAAINLAASGVSTVKLNFAGDVIFSGKVQSLLEQKGYDYPYAYVRDRFKNDDLTVINLETPVTARTTTGADKTYVFKSSPKALGPLKKAGVDVVNLANNHTLDQGIPGLLDTIKNLDKAGIAHVGAGENAAAAYAPVIVERQGIKIAIVGVSRVLPEANWAAGKNHPGAASAYDPEAAARAIKAAKRQADVVVAVVHWGKERVDKPDGNQTTLAHTMIDAGADLIIGGHAHVLQGFEPYKGKWIAYGTGNFIFTRSTVEKTWETGVFQAECSKNGDCDLTFVPYWAELGRPVPMNKADGQKLLRRIESLSPGVKIGANGRVTAKP